MGRAHPIFFQVGRLPTLPTPCRRPWVTLRVHSDRMRCDFFAANNRSKNYACVRNRKNRNATQWSKLSMRFYGSGFALNSTTIRLYYTVKQFNYPMNVTHVVLSWSSWSENEKEKEYETGRYSDTLATASGELNSDNSTLILFCTNFCRNLSPDKILRHKSQNVWTVV